MNQSDIPQRLLYSIAEARHLLGGIGNTLFYELVKKGELHLTRVHGRSLIAASELSRFIEKNSDANV